MHIKHVVLALGLSIIPMGVQAQTSFNMDKFCQPVAATAVAVAEARDSGISVEQITLSFTNEIDDEYGLLVINILFAEAVYNFPRFPPQKEGNFAYDACMKMETEIRAILLSE
jgi:hypothetical protein